MKHLAEEPDPFSCNSGHGKVRREAIICAAQRPHRAEYKFDDAEWLPCTIRPIQKGGEAPSHKVSVQVRCKPWGQWRKESYYVDVEDVQVHIPGRYIPLAEWRPTVNQDAS